MVDAKVAKWVDPREMKLAALLVELMVDLMVVKWGNKSVA